MSSIKGSSDPIRRVDAIDHSYDESEQQRKQKRQVEYMGHQWVKDDEHPREGQHYFPLLQGKEERSKNCKSLLRERILLERAYSLLAQFRTLEEKIAQFFFYKTEAVYDSKELEVITKFLQRVSFGGVIFTGGSYKRESDLIEHYQSVAQLPLLIGNDFGHNLSLYFQKAIPEVRLTTQRCRDLGKAIMGQNRSLGVHFIYDREIVSHDLFQLEEEKKSFRKGIRQAQGVVARDLLPEKALHRIYPDDFSSLWSCKNKGDEWKQEKSEHFIGMRTLFLQESSMQKELLLLFFSQGYDGFITGDLEAGIHILCAAVQEGVISEEEIDKRLLKLLIIKAFFGG